MNYELLIMNSLLAQAFACAFIMHELIINTRECSIALFGICFLLFVILRSKMVEVFKTSVQNQLQARIVRHLLLVENPSFEINFDLEDCDKILRIKNIEDAVDISSVLKMLNETGIYVEVLAD